MTLGEFAVAVGATPKWVQNAAKVLGRKFGYTVDEARHLGLVRQLHAALGVPLRLADEMATDALAAREPPSSVVVRTSTDESVSVSVDVLRYLSSFAVRLSLSRSSHVTRRRGRRAKRPADPVEAAREYGEDITLLHANLARTPAERLQSLEENVAFIRAMRRVSEPSPTYGQAPTADGAAGDAP